MMIKAKIVKDSISPSGVRLTTFVLTYPRFIHSEFMTHRMLSRNASSSRAIPVKKQIQMVWDDPAMPLAFAANKAGMQAGESFGPFKQWVCRTIWKSACYTAVFFAKLMDWLNIHKQYVNRILEPWAHITVVASATDWDNFFALRCHPMAQPEIHELADVMYKEYSLRDPALLCDGQWHLPFVTYEELTTLDNDTCVKMSVARCARVSYLNHDGSAPNIQADIKLYERLVGSAPIHASPAEHQASPAWTSNTRSGNFRGWTQLRKLLANENVEKYTK